MDQIENGASAAPDPTVIKKKERVCGKCNLVIHGQFVRAVSSHFHLDCFRCKDCNKIVADKFFPSTTADEDGKHHIYCETDYFRMLDLICARCQLALRGPYIRVNSQKYHMEHFSCVICDLVFKQNDSYYEKDGNIYCGLHFSLLHASSCGGCKCAVLKNFVETTRDGVVTQWHPCCYMISKMWNIKLVEGEVNASISLSMSNNPESDLEKQKIIIDKVERILHILSSFEESAAACISEMLTHFTNENYPEGVYNAKRLISHVSLLFSSLEDIGGKLAKQNDPVDYSKSKEPKQLVKKIINFFTLISEKRIAEERQAATKDMVHLVTSLAHIFKAIIRSALTGALRLERNHNDATAVELFLLILESSSNVDPNILVLQDTKLVSLNNSCVLCKLPVDEDTISAKAYPFIWHRKCLRCLVCQEAIILEELSFDPLAGSPYCSEHYQPSFTKGAENISVFGQYIIMLNSSLEKLFSAIKFEENDHLGSKAFLTHTKNNSAEIAIPDPPKNEEFFDDEESPIGTAPNAMKRHENSGFGWKVTQEGDDASPFLTEISGLQLLATRQLAALALHRHMEKWYSLGKLLQIAEGPKVSIWSKVFGGKQKKKMGVNRTFGSPLDVLNRCCGVDSTLGFSGTVRIPIIVQECIMKLKRSGMTTEGLFRKNGNIRRLKEQCEEIDSDPKNISFKDDSETQVAALLKKFLRDLPEPLLTETLFDLFMCVPKIEKNEDQLSVIHFLLCLLPKANLDLLAVLVRFFGECSANAVIGDGGTKMDLDNLATVIAPNILYTKLAPTEQTGYIIILVKLIFHANSSIFKLAPAIKDSLASAEPTGLQGKEFIKRYEQSLVLSEKYHKNSSAGTHYIEGTFVEKC